MTAQLSPALAQRAMPVAQKWDGFLGKVNGRLQEILAEADAGLDQLIAQHATDHGPMGAAFGALQARFHGLGNKLDEAWEKIDEEWDELRDELDDIPQQQWEALDDVWEEMYAKYRGMYDGLERHHHTIEMRKNADWARQLRQIAEQEIAQGVACSNCGSPLQVANPAQACQVACGSCRAVNDVHPGMAAGLFYQGLGCHALAHEAAWNEWVAEQDTKSAFDKFRCPSGYDHWVWLQAAHAYWTKYYQVATQIYPAIAPQGIEAAIEGRMGHYRSFEQPIEQQQREFYGQLLEASSKGDAAAMTQLIAAKPHHIGTDDCCTCLVEHEHFDGAAVAFDIKYREDDEEEPKQRWIAEQIREMRRSLR